MEAHAAYLYVLIVGCEVAFWLVLVGALAARYLLRRERLSWALLVSLPVIDLLLLMFTAIDLKAGTVATFAHGLATAYVGFTLAFGSVLVHWTDQRFAHRFAGGPTPDPAPSRGWAVVWYDIKLWLRSIVAWVIALALIVGLIAFIDNDDITQPLHVWFRFALGSVFFWFLFGPAWSVVFFRREAKDRPRSE
jgi:hypothetical protein